MTTWKNVWTCLPKKNIVLLGDFNTKHQEWFDGNVTNSQGIALNDFSNWFDMSQICSKLTHLSRDGVPERVLDLVFTDAPDLFDAPAQVSPPISSSDPLPVVVHCTLSCRFSRPQTSDHVHWQYHLKDQNRMSDAFLFENWAHVVHKNDIDNVGPNGKNSSLRKLLTSFALWFTRNDKRPNQNSSVV